MKINYNVTPKMTMKQINNVLAKGGQIKFKEGTYHITDTLKLNSDSVINACGCKFIKECPNAMIRTKVTKNTTKFGGVNCVRWWGGTIEVPMGAPHSNVIELIHAKNVILEDITIYNTSGLHAIEINGCKEVSIIHCIFSGHQEIKGKEYKEAIQLDFTNYDGLNLFPFDAPFYDGTHNRDIQIQDCVFNGFVYAIGTHTCTTEEKYHKCILVEFCAMGGDSSTALVRANNMRNVNVLDCTAPCYASYIVCDVFKTGHNPHGGTSPITHDVHCKNVLLSTDDVIAQFK